MKASAVLQIVDGLMLDTDKTRWTLADRMMWLNEGQLAIVSIRHDAKSATLDLTLIAGSRQSIPATALRLLGISRNKGGRGITLVSREVMNDLSTSWYTATGKSVIKHYAHDPRVPKEFDTFPPAVAGTIIESQCSLVPTDCVNEDSDIDIDPTYAPALANWICHRAFLRDGESPYAQARAQSYLGAFQLLLTGKTGSDMSSTPAANQPNRVKPNNQ